jgi:EAL domain-containing protein (putative c-di-GMP-specific phosphodiesterase class I)/CheY-like chemotaxis protein
MEQTGLIVPAGEWLLRAVCRQLAAWHEAGIGTVPVAINVSARQLQQPHFAAGVAAALKEHGTDPRLIEFEITESSLMEDAGTAIAVLDELKGLGISLAADDFGTGYSSLSYLKQFPLDALKIDRSFVRDATTDPDDAAIARAVITLGHSLGLRVVAEGVETPAQFTLLRAIGCDEAQGYLFWRPLEVPACTALLAGAAGIDAALLSDAEELPALLIVDRDRGYAKSLAKTLRDAGYPLLIAGSASEAFAVLATNRVGAVVSGRELPDMSGVDLLQRVKRMYPEVKRAMLSSASDLRTVIEAINEGDVHRFFVAGDDERIRAGLLALAGS